MVPTTPPTSDASANAASLSWWERFSSWWAEFSLQTKLLAIATLVVSLVMTGITFFALNGIQPLITRTLATHLNVHELFALLLKQT